MIQFKDCAARVQIVRAGEMTKRGRAMIAKWLRQHADDLERDGERDAPRFTGNFEVRPSLYEKRWQSGK